MDAASASTLSRLEVEVSELSTLIRVLSSSPSLADSDDRSEVDHAIVLFKAALRKLPQADSLYVGYDNGCWLQVRRLDVLDATDETGTAAGIVRQGVRISGSTALYLRKPNISAAIEKAKDGGC